MYFKYRKANNNTAFQLFSPTQLAYKIAYKIWDKPTKESKVVLSFVKLKTPTGIRPN